MSEHRASLQATAEPLPPPPIAAETNTVCTLPQLEALHLDPAFLNRGVNQGFSGETVLEKA